MRTRVKVIRSYISPALLFAPTGSSDECEDIVINLFT